ncbi:hypothetical protein LTR37_010878 [Vermiconidia calcicola]|uniref:Uncharacterized protein n=1 Tax=Vermiconidia calcicola TaxID=1690605 RepID=A0ACC3N505_9PEZI|nr:hypothetical protein LTR37_010878 [Vermiconidia calcicola]
MDLLLVVPRLAQRAGNFALFHMPEAVDNLAGKIFNGGSIIADATGQHTANSTITNTSNAFAQSTATTLDAAFREAFNEGGGDSTSSVFGMILQGIGRLKSFGGIFSYLTSRWALATFTVAIILNRTQFYASSREHLRLRWYMRLALYILPVMAFSVQLLYILQALKCQTSPDFASLRYGDPLKHLSIDFGGEGGFLYNLSSKLLFWQDDMTCCEARNMSLVAVENDRRQLRGSMSLLFTFFLTLCTSQFFETLSSALQGKMPMPETGMTIFEHSLAFAECEAMISSALGFGFFGKLDSAGSTSPKESSGPLVIRGELLQRLNVPPEVLLVCLISCFSHLSSATLAITGLRNKVRLVNTAIWACCYIGAFMWSFAKIFMNPIESVADLGVLRFPTVCIVGFIPHLLILIGILVCAIIYGLALVVTALSVPEDAAAGLSFRQRLSWAYENLQANVQFSASSSIRIKMSEDFYTTLLKVGFSVLTAASEAVYLNEGSRVRVAQMTWVEQKRIDEFATSIDRRNMPTVPSELLGEGIAKGVEYTDHHNIAISASPYARERRSKPTKSDLWRAKRGEVDSGLGLAQRRNRMQLTFDFIAGMSWLLVGLQAQLLLNTLRKCRIAHRPGWLLKAAGTGQTQAKQHKDLTPAERPKQDFLDFWVVGADGRLSRNQDSNVDVEEETRRRLHHAGNYTGEESLSDNLYGWWRSGGWFGELDQSGDYRTPTNDDNDDTTSMISMSTNASTPDGEHSDTESGRRTPTQRDPYGSRDPSPEADGVASLDLDVLSHLLNPRNPVERDEARLLSHSLQSTRPMTRSQYRRETERNRAQLLSGLRRQGTRIYTDDEEEQDLEQFILEQRSKARVAAQSRSGATWESGAEGMGAGGPQCVVCQSAPRTILVWPCGCLNQHGLRDDDAAVLLSSADDAGTEAGSAEQVAADAALAASLQQGDEPPQATRRVSRKSTPSPPSGLNRITEYEKASTPPVRKREGPAFEVLKKHRSPNDKRSVIQELPNEVLTHTLAHLSPTDLTSVALVSKRFHDLVTEPHAWRSAFAHFFPGPDSLHFLFEDDDDSETQAVVRSERRAFTRLTALASWRSEYIMRTRLLRSLARGKPVAMLAPPSSSRSGQAHTASSIIMYNSQLFTTINHMHATFGTGLNKRLPRFIHGADDQGTATSSDPAASKVDHWGLSDPQFFLQFAERFPGDSQYGLGLGEIVGVPNVMDVSQPYGMIHGEGSPGGMVYYRSTDEMRGRFLLFSSAMSVPNLGVPKIPSTQESMCAVWIAKSSSIPSLTDGLIGLLSGSSLGVLTAYSLGSTNNSNRDQRFGRGEMTARWVLSPGVPLIAIAVDGDYSMTRYAQNRIWAVVLNALGEVFYLTKFPKRPHVDRGTRIDDEIIERTAWLTGRSVYWNIVESSRRIARPDPYADSSVDGSYSPRTSWNGMCLSQEQIQAETREIEAFANKKPKEFQKACLGWDMRRKLEVDFAGNDGNNAGENVLVFECGIEEGSLAVVKRYTRCRFQDRQGYEASPTPPSTSGSTQASESPSLFGGTTSPPTAPTPNFSFDRLEESLSQDDFDGSITPRPMTEEWRSSEFALGGLKNMQILATAMDDSVFATQTISEDPLLSFSGRSTTSSPSLTPMSPTELIADSTDIPGQRARLFAAGTKTGSVLLWNIRAPVARSAETSNTIEPVRVIHTDSPQISCLGLSSLYLVHGGNDGLVQAWDPLASNMQPIRTLNSRFSSRARRRLVQAQASPQGVGINLFAAGAICLDPDPSVLRGMVSLGTHLRYWSYSSSAADQYKSHKRRLRRSERGSNNGGERFSGVTRSNLKDYIANEKSELDREKKDRKKEAQRFAGRFGTNLLDGSEEEMLAYAALLSQESLEQETKRRTSDISTVISSTDQSTSVMDKVTPIGSPSPVQSTPKTDEELDADMLEAIRLSLASSSPSADIPIRQGKQKGGKMASPPRRASPPFAAAGAGSSNASVVSDLEFAIQLSLAEEQSKRDAAAAGAGGDDFPALSPSEGDNGGKGKGRIL